MHVKSLEETPEGWAWVSLLKGGMGSFVKPQREGGSQQNAFFGGQDSEVQDDLAAAALRKQMAPELSQAEFDEQLHKQFLKLLTPLTMDGEAARDNRRRGARSRTLSQMELSGHRQIEHGEAVAPGLDMLAHVDHGRWTGPSCELMPLANADGKIVACQMRLPDGSQRWLSNDDHPMQRKDGSWPAAMHNIQPGAEINGCDGVKKASLLAALTGQPVWGSAGSRYLKTSTEVRAVLERICPPELGSFRVVINVDAGDASNVSGINNEILRFTCLVASWGYDCLIRYWGQDVKPGEGDSGATFSDIDELLLNHPEEGIPQELLTPEEYKARLSPMVRRQLDKDSHDIDFSALGVHVYPKHRLPQLELPTPKREPRWFADGEFVRALRTAFQGNRYVHDARLMGLGKSFDISLLEPEHLGFTRVIWVSSQHLDTWHSANKQFQGSSTPQWAVMRGRDSGRKWGTGDRIVRKTADNTDRADALAPNCSRADMADEMYRKGMTLKVRQICRRCPDLSVCTSNSDWFRRAREETIEASRVICHPLNLAAVPFWDHLGRPFSRDYAPEEQGVGTLLILEEANLFPWTTTVSFSLSDVLSHATEIGDSGLNPNLIHLVETFARCVRGKDEVSHQTVWTAFQEEIRPGAYDKDDEHEMQCWEEDQVDAGRFSKAWLRHLLTVLDGQGRVWMEKGTVSLMVRNQDLIDLLKHRGVSVLLSDGTAPTSEFEEWLDAPVAVIAERPPSYTPAQIHQITGVGRLGYGRSKSDRAKVDALIAVLGKKFNLEPDHVVIDIGREAAARDKEGQLALGWMQSSRGSNICVEEGTRDLVMVGAPLPPISHILHKYCLRTDRQVELTQRTMVFRKFWTKQDSEGIECHYVEGSFESADPGFRAEVRGILEREVEQGRHRLREVRRGTPDNPVRVFWVSDVCISHWELAGLWDYDELVGNRLEVTGLTRARLIQASAEIRRTERLSTKALLAALQCSPSDLKAAFAEFDLGIAKLRNMDIGTRPKQPVKRKQASPPTQPLDEADLPSSTTMNRLPLGTVVSYRGQLEGTVVGYQGGLPEKVVVRVQDANGDTSDEAIPADLLHISDAFV